MSLTKAVSAYRNAVLDASRYENAEHASPTSLLAFIEWERLALESVLKFGETK